METIADEVLKKAEMGPTITIDKADLQTLILAIHKVLRTFGLYADALNDMERAMRKIPTENV